MRRRLTLALAIAAAAVLSGLAATSAFATAYGNVTFISGNGGSATWAGAPNKHSAVELSVPSGGYATIALDRFSATPPADAPSFATDNYAAGSPRFVIQFAGGGYLFGYPSQFGSKWEVAGCYHSAYTTYTDYATALADLEAGSQGDNSSCAGDVTDVFVVADASGGPETDSITSLVYDGTAYIG